MSTSTAEQQRASPTVGSQLRKKLILRLSSNRRLGKALLADKDTWALLESLHRLLASYYEERLADKMVKHLVKLVVKMACLVREGRLSQEQQLLVEEIDTGYQHLVLTLLSFQKVAFSYNYNYLLSRLESLKAQAMELISGTLSGKSIRRAEFVFCHLSQKAFLDATLGTFLVKEHGNGANCAEPSQPTQDDACAKNKIEEATSDFFRSLNAQ